MHNTALLLCNYRIIADKHKITQSKRFKITTTSAILGILCSIFNILFIHTPKIRKIKVSILIFKL